MDLKERVKQSPESISLAVDYYTRAMSAEALRESWMPKRSDLESDDFFFDRFCCIYDSPPSLPRREASQLMNTLIRLGYLPALPRTIHDSFSSYDLPFSCCCLLGRKYRLCSRRVMSFILIVALWLVFYGESWVLFFFFLLLLSYVFNSFSSLPAGILFASISSTSDFPQSVARFREHCRVDLDDSFVSNSSNRCLCSLSLLLKHHRHDRLSSAAQCVGAASSTSKGHSRCSSVKKENKKEENE